MARFGAVAALAAAAFGLTAGAASAGTTAHGPARTAPAALSPYKVCQIYELTGIYNPYAQEFYQGFTIGMRYATGGSDAVDRHPVQVSWNDDDDSTTTAVTDFKSCVGAGDTIIGGSIDSGVADELAPLAAQNKVLYISGAAAADNITGANRYTFRSGRQTYQDTVTGASYVAAAGKHQRIVLLAQDYAFGLS
ncbi:MAG TPA: ABC transporter substrate-binding protein, partial [Acidimicrobiales bacterium]|nr:ABC transporter substrate-binding protein [Acidimicrobiales bacterium]